MTYLSVSTSNVTLANAVFVDGCKKLSKENIIKLQYSFNIYMWRGEGWGEIIFLGVHH